MLASISPEFAHSSAITEAEPEDVFNLSLFEYRFLIDCRSTKRVAEGKIISAFSFPFISRDESPESLQKRFALVLQSVDEKGTPEHISPIVFYGDDESQGLVAWISFSLKRLQTTRATEFEFLLHQMFPSSIELIRSILKPETKIWILKGGYESFKLHFPILCGIGLSLEYARSLPAAITRGVFLGSRDTNSLERRDRGQLGYDLITLRGLGISHAVVNASMPLALEDSSGLLCLRIDAPDCEDETSDMAPFWTAACLFIADARSSGHKVLIHFHGRSRGASFAVAWAMYSMRMDFSAALAYVRGRVFYRLDPTLMYLKQLSEWSAQLPQLEGRKKQSLLL